MRYKTLLTLIISTMFLTTNAQVDDATKFNMFCAAFANLSSSPNYVVVHIKNKKTGVVKEVCTEAPFLQGAIRLENGQGSIDCKSYKKGYFEFSNVKALSNIGFDRYTEDELKKYAKSISLSDIIQQIKSGKLTERKFNGNVKEQLMFAHLMFNNGIMMTRGCIDGTLCGLSYFYSK